MKKLKRIIYSRWFSVLFRPFAVLLFRMSKITSNFIIKKAKINGGEINYFGVPIKFPSNTGITFLTNIYWKGDDGFEYEIGNYLKKNILKFDYFFDIGANFGFYSAFASKINPNLKIFSFEPLTTIYNNQTEFFKLNNVKAKSENLALSNSEGVATFYIPEKDIPSEIHTATLNSDFFYNKHFKMHTEQIKTITLDKYIDKLPLTQNDRVLIKIDVEGHELNVLKGALNFFKNHKPVLVCEIEMKNETINELFEFISGLGYDFYLFQNNYLIKTKKEDLINFSGAPNFLVIHESLNITGAGNIAKI